MRRALLPLVAAFAMVAACTLLYNPDRLAGSETPDGDLGRAIIDAAADPDAPVSDDGALPDDAIRGDAALADAGQRDAAMRDAAVDAARADAAIRDAAVDAPQPDASPPDAPDCGGTNEACCAGPNPCEPWNECTGGACRACGALLQSCCDPGMSCQFGICLAGICT
jgi:hypothetical protein